MNSSVFPTLRGLSYLFLLHFLVLALTMIYGCSSSQRGCSHYETMPVVTRSKARMIRSSINEEHTLQLTSNILKNETTCSIHEHILTDKSSPASNNELPSIVLSSSSSSSICNSVINTEQLPSSSPLGVSFQGDTPTNFSNFRNFKIPNFHTTELPLGHNSYSHHFTTMHLDCEDCTEELPSTPNVPDISQLFASLSTQMTYQTKCLQDKLSTDFSQVVQNHDIFKKEVREEFDELRVLIAQQSVKPEVSTARSPTTVPSAPSVTSGLIRVFKFHPYLQAQHHLQFLGGMYRPK
jgi:hypothetical protein